MKQAGFQRYPHLETTERVARVEVVKQSAPRSHLITRTRTPLAAPPATVHASLVGRSRPLCWITKRIVDERLHPDRTHSVEEVRARRRAGFGSAAAQGAVRGVVHGRRDRGGLRRAVHV
jgi:hypothetical protein